MERQVKFDIALSFAGEDREYVHKVANILLGKGISLFYDFFEEENLWGKNLYDYLSDVYRNQAFYTIMFVSEHYNKKRWANHERQAMQSRAFQENREYVLPARFDDTEIPGLLDTIGYLSLRNKTPEEFAEIVCKKLIHSGRTIPSENIRKSLSPIIEIPKIDPQKFQVTVVNELKNPVPRTKILLIADNNTTLLNLTNELGVVNFQINTRRKYKLFLSHIEYPSVIIENIDPVNDLLVEVHSSENIGSLICESGTGYIPGLKGRLAPILDSHQRTYLYATNIAVDGGKEQQPIYFKIGQPLDLEDCDGMIMQITFRDIQGNSSVLDFVKPIIK